MKILYSITHGSKTSVDNDIYLVVDEIPTKQEFSDLKHAMISDVNCIKIENGQVVGCFKGTVDEINNSIYYTFDNHPQHIEECPVKSPVEREYFKKSVSSLREMLAFVSRTQYRDTVKKAIKSPDLSLKIDTLKSIKISEIKDFEKAQKEEVYKFFSQQICMITSLIKSVKEGNPESFDKEEFVLEYPKLKPFLFREKDKTEEHLPFLEDAISEYSDFLKVHLFEMIETTEGSLYHLKNGKILNIKNEQYLD